MHARPSLDAADIQQVLDAALHEAQANAWAVSIAIVDDGGHLLAFQRMPGATPSSARIAIAKARSAALFRRPTAFFAERLATSAGLAGLPGVLPVPGGVPLLYQAHALGAVAASGVAAEFDARIATAGMRALACSALEDPAPTPH